MYTTRNISPTNNQANIVELHPACVYSIRMYSYNKIGRSLPSKELTISTEEACKLVFSPAEIVFCFPLLWHLLPFCVQQRNSNIENNKSFDIFNSTWWAPYGCNPPTDDISEYSCYMEGKSSDVLKYTANYM